MNTNLRTYTIGEEICSSVVHGIGIVFSIVALTILVTLSSLKGNPWAIVSTAIFGTSMILLYTASTVYHAILNLNIKKKLKKFDHISIYYLIAGSYTPYLFLIRGALGWTFFGLIWALALTGTFLKLFLKNTSGTKFWSVGLYLLMGWLAIFAFKAFISVLPLIGIVFLILGGLFYTVGVFFYVKKNIKYMHSIWHFFVLAGTMMHFFSILYSCVLR